MDRLDVYSYVIVIDLGFSFAPKDGNFCRNCMNCFTLRFQIKGSHFIVGIEFDFSRFPEKIIIRNEGSCIKSLIWRKDAAFSFKMMGTLKCDYCII